MYYTGTEKTSEPYKTIIMNQTQIQIIGGNDFLLEIQKAIENTSAIQCIKALGDIYIDSSAAMQILDVGSYTALENRVKRGVKNQVGKYIKLPKYFPFDNSKPGYLLHEVIAYKRI